MGSIVRYALYTTTIRALNTKKIDACHFPNHTRYLALLCYGWLEQVCYELHRIAFYLDLIRLPSLSKLWQIPNS